jgi:tRNA G26 N,N-dimethylase Trm1
MNDFHYLLAEVTATAFQIMHENSNGNFDFVRIYIRHDSLPKMKNELQYSDCIDTDIFGRMVCFEAWKIDPVLRRMKKSHEELLNCHTPILCSLETAAVNRS